MRGVVSLFIIACFLAGCGPKLLPKVIGNEYYAERIVFTFAKPEYRTALEPELRRTQVASQATHNTNGTPAELRIRVVNYYDANMAERLGMIGNDIEYFVGAWAGDKKLFEVRQHHRSSLALWPFSALQEADRDEAHHMAELLWIKTGRFLFKYHVAVSPKAELIFK